MAPDWSRTLSLVPAVHSRSSTSICTVCSSSMSCCLSMKVVSCFPIVYNELPAPSGDPRSGMVNYVSLFFKGADPLLYGFCRVSTRGLMHVISCAPQGCLLTSCWTRRPRPWSVRPSCLLLWPARTPASCWQETTCRWDMKPQPQKRPTLSIPVSPARFPVKGGTGQWWVFHSYHLMKINDMPLCNVNAPSMLGHWAKYIGAYTDNTFCMPWA